MTKFIMLRVSYLLKVFFDFTRLVLLILLVLFDNETFAQQQHIIFNHFSVNNGLINDEIDHIFIDSEGFVWLGSATGLQQYDGYNFKEYQFNTDDTTSISDNFITTISEDEKGNIWIGTFSSGLEMYDKKLDVFHHFEKTDEARDWLIPGYIPKGKNVIVFDKHNLLWVNTFDYLYKIDLNNKRIAQFHNDFAGQIVYDSIHHVIWIAGEGLRKFDLDSEKLSTFKPATSIPQFSQINAILNDENSTLWLGTESGLVLFDPNSSTYISLVNYFKGKGIITKEDYTWADSPIRTLYEDYLGNIWIGLQYEIYVINKKNGSLRYYTHEVDNYNSLLDEEIKEIYGNKKGVIWISYMTRGVSKVIINTKKFNAYRHIPGDKNSLSGYKVRSVFKDNQDELWVGTFNNGLNRIPQEENPEVYKYLHVPGDNSTISSNYITAIYTDKKDRLWIGTFKNGLCYADNIHQSKNLKFKRHFSNGDFEVHEFMEDPFGRIWICTLNGFYIYNYQTDTFVQYGHDELHEQELTEINIQSVEYESPNILWLATWNRGLCKLTINSDSMFTRDQSKDSLIVYNQIHDENHSSIDPRFITIMRDANKRIWLGSNVEGLVKMTNTPNGVKFIKYDKSRGAPGNSVFGIAHDRKGYIWISTNNGIGKFNPELEEFSNYHESDGLLANAFTWDASFQADDGEIFFGNSNGLNTFYPDSILDNRIESNVYLSRLVINNNEVSINEKVNGRVIIEKALRFTDEILLTHKEHAFSIEFSALDYGDPEEIQYRYLLEGFDEDWIETNAEKRYVTYTNLPPGSYTFIVQGTNSDGIWNNDQVQLKVEILRAPWKTFWAYSIYLIIFIVLLYLFWWEIMRWSKLKRDLAIEHVKHEKDNELNWHKVQFFTNMAHELRTPLTLILGPLQRMIQRHDGNNRIHQNHLLIERNANRLLKLTSQLMDFQKFESGNLRLKAAEGNVIKFLKEICIAFKHNSYRKEISFNANLNSQEVLLWYDRDKLENVVFNLLSNAMKYTPPKGVVSISLDEKSTIDIKEMEASMGDKFYTSYGELPEKIHNVIEIKVEDTGCGISQEHLTHIFNRFYRTERTFVDGTGIGLEIVKNNVELHHGKIGVFSLEDRGTSFFVWLPKGNSHLTKNEILNNFKNSEHQDHYRYHHDEILLKKKLIDEETTMADKKQNGSRLSILLADDNPEILVFLKEIFQSDYHVYTALDGDDALRLAFEIIPDLIISDIMMPGIDGLELCKQCKEDVRTSHIPIILLTARTSMIFKSEGYEIGADDYINKPFDPKLLERRVKNLIESRIKLRKKYGSDITLTPKDITLNDSDEKFLERLIKYIEDHIGESDLKIEHVAKAIGISHSLLYKKLLALTNLTIVEFINTIRLKKASVLLINSQYTVSQTAYEVGFSDPKYFSKCFQAFFKTTPTDFIERHRIKEPKF
jgi:signal transduction histidine kinase/ligand-binding sensor domain-containing protein/AraC-like DNA-binding protein/ActR/RegA family two-component response regulator